MKYRIFNRKTQTQIGGLYSCRKRAERRADKLDLEYGAYIHSVQPVLV